jgi:polar amino acid transport system permease protein
MSDFIGFFIESLPNLLEGLSVTLLLTFVSLIVGFVLGIALALGRIYAPRLISWLCIGYIEIMRGTPLLVQLFILYFGLPSVGIRLTPITAAVIGLSLNSGAYQAEYLRGSIQGITSGQMVAARTLGMTKLQAIVNVILPQAMRTSIPAWSNELIYLLKYTSIAYIIQVVELTATFRFLEIFTMIAIIYLSLTVLFTEIIDRIEQRIRIPGLGTKRKTSLRNA